MKHVSVAIRPSKPNGHSGFAGAAEEVKVRRSGIANRVFEHCREVGKSFGKKVCDKLHSFFALLGVGLPLVAHTITYAHVRQFSLMKTVPPCLPSNSPTDTNIIHLCVEGGKKSLFNLFMLFQLQK